MSLNPLNELKRRLEDDNILLPKRLRLAKNVVHSAHFPAAPKERIVAEWLKNITESNGLSQKDIKDIIGWLQVADDLTGDLKCRLIKVVSQYLHNNPLNNDDIQHIVLFLENDKISTQLALQVDDYLFVTITLLQNLRDDDAGKNILIHKLLNNIIKYYKESKRKLEFIIKFLEGENLETIFSYLDSQYHNKVMNICQNILFPITKKSFFASFLINLIRKDNIDELKAEKGDNIQSVIKIMSTFFMFPKGRTGKDQKFISDFIETFVASFQKESQLIFAFYIMATNSLNMDQNYLNSAMKMPPIMFEENDEKIKRSIFLNMLNILLKYEVDINVKLTDILGEKGSRVVIKKNFMSFLQTAMMGQLKLEGKVDIWTLQIINLALKLDPSLIEQKMDQILPPIMTAKKNNNVLETYIEMLNSLLEILFKLSRGTSFINQILPNIKLSLEAINVEQFELKQKLNNSTDNKSLEKLKNKIINGNDVIPNECVETYGKLSSELMFRQNKDLLLSLQKDFEETCLMMLEEGFVSPSIITLSEVLSAILSSFFRYSKMADHTVPLPIAEEFWSAFEKFERECIKTFGECILKLNYNEQLVLCFLNLCLSYSQLKLLNIKYSNTKVAILKPDTSEIFDCSVILPCLSCQQWITLASMIQDDKAVLVWDNLLLVKTMAIELISVRNAEDHMDDVATIKIHLIKQLSENPDIIRSNSYFTRVLFANLNSNQAKQLAKCLVKLYITDTNTDVLKTDAVLRNRYLLNALVIETTKSITKYFSNGNTISKAMNKIDFNIVEFIKTTHVKVYFKENTIVDESQDEIMKYIEILKDLPIYNLEEKYQLVAIFVLLSLKKCCQVKKIRRNIDHFMQMVYELSPKYPDLYKIFPIEFIFSFDDDNLLDLLTLTIKTSNKLLIIRGILESAVKKVKTDSEIVKNIVDILLTRKKSDKNASIEYFNDTVFQLECLILPIIAKEKRAATSSTYRSILANLQEKLHQSMLESFMHLDFSNIGSFCNDDTSNTDESGMASENRIATLNAMGAYSLTLSKYCETTDGEEIKKLDCLWSGLEFFIQSAIQTVQNPKAKPQDIDTAMQLLNISLRYIKKLETHTIFENKDDLFKQIWQSVKTRLLVLFDERKTRRRVNNNCFESIAVTLKFLAELSSMDCFVSNFVGDITSLAILKKPSIILKNEDITNSQLVSQRVSKYLIQHCLKANIVGPKCVAISKQMFRICKNIQFWIHQHYDGVQDVERAQINNEKRLITPTEDANEGEIDNVKIEDPICELLRINSDMLSDVILAAKKIPVDYRFLDSIFELQHMVLYILGHSTINAKCDISFQAFFGLHKSCLLVLNNLLLSREELLEDRWPCFMQCFKTLILCLCKRTSSSQQVDRDIEQKLAESAHSIEKLTQSICKRKTHVSRIAAYAVADICTWIEKTAPPKMVRQHLENSVALLIQVSDSTYAMAFLKRSLAGSVGQMTMSNLYMIYKKYHKYVGNA